tara:strand:+ start:734 stop:1411 length:678 start_codon:yes stop_codon:yes gene_type:complete
MATVRFSDKLKDEITRSAKDVFKEKLKEAKDNKPVTWSGDYLYNFIFSKDLRDKMNALPKGFMETESRITWAGFSNVPQEEEDKYSRDFWHTHDHLTFDFPAPRPMPHGNNTNPEWEKNWRSITLNYDIPRFATIQAEWKTWMDGVVAIKAKQGEFVKGVNHVTGTYATLAPALKAFPALWDLIPEQYRERHLEIVARKRGSPSELGDLDVDALTSVVTLSKITR